MDDNRLDTLLREAAGGRFVPPPALVRRTKAMLRGRRLLQAMVFLSLFMQLLAVMAIVFVLTSPDVPTTARVFGAIGVLAYLGCLIVAAVAARERVAWFFKRVEWLVR